METMRWRADASCSRSAASRRRLVGRVLLPAARAAQPSEHEDLLGSAMSRNCLGTGIMGACDIAPTLHFVEPVLKLNAEEHSPRGAGAQVFVDLGQRAVARQQAGL